MRANQITDKTKVVEYDSLHEFYEYLIHTPFNDAFRWAKYLRLMEKQKHSMYILESIKKER